MAKSKEFPYEELLNKWCERTKRNVVSETEVALKKIETRNLPNVGS